VDESRYLWPNRHFTPTIPVPHHTLPENGVMSSNRRDFLKTSAAAVASLASAGLIRSEDKKDTGDFGGFTVGMQTYTFRKFSLEQALKRTQDLGLKFVEFTKIHVPVKSTPEQIKAAKTLAADYGITPIAFGVETFTKNHDANKQKFEFAAALGVKNLSADPDPDSFDSLDKLVDEHQITIAIHPHGPSGGKMHRWPSAEFIMKAVKDHHKLIGTCLDTGHLIRSAQLGVNLDPATEIRTMGARNFGLHLKDHDNKKKTDVVYGKGVLNVDEVLKALREVKFAGYIAIEYEANEDEPSPDVKACVAILKDAAKRLG
jgi:inosose dehydratase